MITVPNIYSPHDISLEVLVAGIQHPNRLLIDQ
jgi:hypothetical protein